MPEEPGGDVAEGWQSFVVRAADVDRKGPISGVETVRTRQVLSLSFVGLLALAHAVPVSAQNQAALKKAFGGREVAVLMDMPASHKGIDLYLQREPELDFADYASRTKTFGISLQLDNPAGTAFTSDALPRFPQLLVAPALLAILWSGLFGRFAPLDVRELMRAHIDLLFGKGGAP